MKVNRDVKGEKMATIDTVKETLSENLDITGEKVTEDATLESLGIDSLDMVELICDLEEKCDIEFGEPEGINTIGELVAHIDSL
jgi:acyl carrier protein